MQVQNKQDTVVVNDFVKHLREHGHPEIRIDRIPNEENRSTRDIDAIAFPFAIEHTSIDAVENLRRNQDAFARFATPLRNALDGQVAFHLRVNLDFDSIQRGPNLHDIQAAFESWVRIEANLLPDGRTSVSGATGIPFAFEAEKQTSGPAGLFLTRIVPTQNTLAERMKEIVERKTEKLRPYHLKYATLLLIENGDSILMNKDKMLGAIHRSYLDGAPNGVDQIWYADTSSRTRSWFIHVTPYLKRANHSLFAGA